MNGLLCCSALVTALLTAAALLTTSEPIRETPVVHLASEHSVGFELEAACGAAFQHEAGALCPAGEPPYKLRGDPSSGCTSYFWCSPTRGACVRACAGGMVFDEACMCCRDAASAGAAYDANRCSSSTPRGRTHVQSRAQLQQEQHQQVPGGGVAARALLAREPTIMLAEARARARLAARRRRRAAAEAVAVAATALDTGSGASRSDDGVLAQTEAPMRASVWSADGKHYLGPWANRAVVKEPAIALPSSRERRLLSASVPVHAVARARKHGLAAAAVRGPALVALVDGGAAAHFVAGRRRPPAAPLAAPTGAKSLGSDDDDGERGTPFAAALSSAMRGNGGRRHAATV